MITLAVIAIGLIIAVGGGVIDAYRDYQKQRQAGTITMAQLYESMQIANEADVCLSLTLRPMPYDWAHEYCPDLGWGRLPCTVRGPHTEHWYKLR